MKLKNRSREFPPKPVPAPSTCGGPVIENIVWILAVLVIVQRLMQLGLKPSSFSNSFNKNLETMEQGATLSMTPEKYSEQVLGLGSGFALSDVKSAYRKLSLNFHPDKPTGDESKFRELVMAQKCLLKRDDASCGEISEFIPAISRHALPRLRDFSLSSTYKYGPLNFFRDYLISFGFTSLATAETGIKLIISVAHVVVEKIVSKLFGGNSAILSEFLTYLLTFRIAPTALGLLGSTFLKAWHILRSPICFIIRRALEASRRVKKK